MTETVGVPKDRLKLWAFVVAIGAAIGCAVYVVMDAVTYTFYGSLFRLQYDNFQYGASFLIGCLISVIWALSFRK